MGPPNLFVEIKTKDENSKKPKLLTPAKYIGTPMEWNGDATATGTQMIFAHGLTPNGDCKAHDHTKDGWVDVFESAVNSLKAQALTYTARGHGESTGWEAHLKVGKAGYDQFTWQEGGEDLLRVADSFGYHTGFVAGGTSMGGAAAMHAVALEPDRVRCLVMVRPPTAWETRPERRKGMEETVKNQKKLQKKDKRDHWAVYEAHIQNDLPEKEDIEFWNKITVPTLILALGDDTAHPMSTAEELEGLIKGSKLVKADTKEEAMAAWPKVIAEFIKPYI